MLCAFWLLLSHVLLSNREVQLWQAESEGTWGDPDDAEQANEGETDDPLSDEEDGDDADTTFTSLGVFHSVFDSFPRIFIHCPSNVALSRVCVGLRPVDNAEEAEYDAAPKSVSTSCCDSFFLSSPLDESEDLLL